jgi:hypothetical protein
MLTCPARRDGDDKLGCVEDSARVAAAAAAQRIRELIARRQRLMDGAPTTDEDVKEAQRCAQQSLSRARLAHTRSGLAHERAADAHEHAATAKEELAGCVDEIEAARLRQEARVHREAAAGDRRAARLDREHAAEG